MVTLTLGYAVSVRGLVGGTPQWSAGAMDLLVLGGTAWLGRYVAAAALARGHRVVCLARGSSGEAPAGARLVRADRDRPDALAALLPYQWDAVVDVARQPGQVRRAVAALAPRAAHYVFVSTVSVYADPATVGQDESAPTLAPLAGDLMTGMDEYGAAKVACERHVLEGFGADRSLVARSGLIAGPDDHTGRSGYWPWRFAHPSGPDGAVLVPDSPTLPTQLIDVRDLAGWLVDAAERRCAGVVNAVGDVVPLGEHLATARSVARHTGPLVTVDSGWLAEQGVQEFMGPRSLPLWLDDPGWLGFTAHEGSRGRALGLTPRPLAATLRDALDYESHRPADKPRPSGLTDAEELDLIAAWRSR